MATHPTIPRRIVALLLLLSFVLGAVSSFAMAPYNLFPLLFLTISGLYLILTRIHTPRMAALCGWCFGVGYFGFGLYWIGNALLVSDNPYIWVWPLAIGGLPVLLSFFTALGCWAVKKFCNTRDYRFYLGFTGFLTASEWLRGHILTGFPWNLFGYTWADILPMIQITSIGNVYLLTLLTILWSALPAYLYTSTESRRQKITLASLAIATFAVSFIYGTIQLNIAQTGTRDDVTALIIQPNISQDEKWSAEKASDHFLKLVRMSKNSSQNNNTGTTLIIWPETALTQRYINDKTAMKMIKNMLAEYNDKAYLLTGALRYLEEDKTFHNSLIMINREGNIQNIYDKSHLVPFGEYIPFENIINIAPFVGFSGFVSGTGIKTMSTPEGFRYSPLVCYEVIFPGAVTEKGTPSPDAIINVTNDGWYGISSGPYQHFTQTIFRAVEERIPVIRVANTGFSGIIDPWGRITYSSELHIEEIKSSNIPRLPPSPGWSSDLRQAIFVLANLIFLIFSLFRRPLFSI